MLTCRFASTRQAREDKLSKSWISEQRAAINLQEAGDEDIDPADRIGLLSSAAKNIATLARASVNQKKFRLEEQARIEREAREKLIAEQEEKLQELRGADGMSEQMEARIRRILLGKE